MIKHQGVKVEELAVCTWVEVLSLVDAVRIL